MTTNRVERARARRLAVGLTQADLAGLADVGPSTIRNIETGHTGGERTLPAVERTLGLAVRTRRREIGLSQDDLGLLAGYSRASVKTVEAGRPVGPTTLHSLHNAIGCQPDDGGLREVLPPEAVRAVADVVLPVLDTAEGKRLRLEWHALVDALADDPPSLPDGFGYLWARLRDRLRPARFAVLAGELRQRVGDLPDGEPAPQRAGPGRTTAGALIAGSGLSAETQAALIDYLTRRREQVEAGLLDEVHAAIELLRRSAGVVVAGCGCGAGNPATTTEDR